MRLPVLLSSGLFCGFALCCAQMYFSCSLDYGSDEKIEKDSVPEYSFSDTFSVQYEDGLRTSSMRAGSMEQYQGRSSVYAEDISFRVYETDGSVEADGSCLLFSADSDAGQYVFSGQIRIRSYKDNILFAGERLRWNGKTEQLVGAEDDLVQINKDRDASGGNKTSVSVSGQNFSASGVSRTYRFGGSVSGVIETFDEETGIGGLEHENP